MTANPKRINILGTWINDVTLDEAVEQIRQQVAAHQVQPEANPAWRVVTANPEYVMAARRDKTFQALLNTAGLVTPDGIGLILAGKLLHQPFRGRVTGVALVHALAKRSAANGDMSLFLLGAAPGVAESAAVKLRELYPNVKIVGTFAGSASPEGDTAALQQIKNANPTIILVAYGQVKQDWWSARNLHASGAAVAIGVGGVFDYLAGRSKLAPRWMRQAGLEWLYRLYREPWRWRRQIALLRFVAAVLLATPRNRIKKN